MLAGAPGASEIGDRAEAIRTAVAMLQPGDVVLVAGKGHETGQIVGDTVLPFSDHDVAGGGAGSPMTNAATLVIRRLVDAAGAAADGRSASAAITGFSIDTRTLEPGDVFVALEGSARRP